MGADGGGVADRAADGVACDVGAGSSGALVGGPQAVGQAAAPDTVNPTTIQELGILMVAAAWSG